MNCYGIKRVSGKGYENKNVIVKKRRKRDLPFFLFLGVFGAFVYLAATTIFRSALLSDAVLSFSILL